MWAETLVRGLDLKSDAKGLAAADSQVEVTEDGLLPKPHGQAGQLYDRVSRFLRGRTAGGRHRRVCSEGQRAR